VRSIELQDTGANREEYLAGTKCGDYLAAIALDSELLDSELLLRAEPSSRSVKSAQTISLGIEDCSEATPRHAEDERARIAEHFQPDRFIPSSRRDSWIRIGRRKGS
jgi:hypothetical protein